MSANLDVSNILAHHSFSLVGSTVDICGPFGSVQGANAVLNASSVILVGGGIGIAPLISFLDALFIKLSAQLLERAGGGGRSNLQSAAVWGQVSFFLLLIYVLTADVNNDIVMLCESCSIIESIC